MSIFLPSPEATHERHLRRTYRLLWATLLGGVAAIMLIASLLPNLIDRYPGRFALMSVGFFVGLALYGRWNLSRQGVPGAEFLAYANSRPSMWVAHGAIALMLWWKACHPSLIP